MVGRMTANKYFSSPGQDLIFSENSKKISGIFVHCDETAVITIA